MNWASHRLFGRIIAEQYGLPIAGYIEWTIMPDMQYYKDSYWRHILLHRISLHGPENIGVVIDQGRQSRYVVYKEGWELYIRCLVMSHSFLDLFNFIIVPSYPGKFGFTFIREQLPRILSLTTIEAPDGLSDALRLMVSHHRGPEDLLHTMLLEYRELPKVGWYMEQILKLYRR